jgi:DNA-binding XRE family transcriptional regulator
MIKNNLKEIRMKEYMLNKKEFAKMLDIAEQQYLRYENGITAPSLEVCLKIAKALSKKMDDIWHL